MIRYVLLLIAFALTSIAQEKPQKATIADAAWMQGSWTAQALGGTCEETWSAPAGGAMMGSFRLLKDGAVVFYEFFVIREENGSLVLRLKHFHPDMKGWEEKDKTVEFPLLQSAAGKLQFDGLIYRREDANTLVADLAIKTKDGKIHHETFRFLRAAKQQ